MATGYKEKRFLLDSVMAAQVSDVCFSFYNAWDKESLS